MKLKTALLGLICIAAMAASQGCQTTAGTPQQSITTAGTNAVAIAWIGYGTAADAATIIASEGRMSQATANKVSADFTAAYNLIETMQTLVTSTATTQPTLDTINQDALAIATAILQISTDLKGAPPIGTNPPVTLNIPAPPAS